MKSSKHHKGKFFVVVLPRNKQKTLDEHACAVDVLVAKIKVEQLGIAYFRKIHLNALNGTLAA